ncbi:hypothetical protein D3C85_475770 [compost metagenome]
MNRFDGATSEELLKFAQTELPGYRKLLSRLRSFVMGLFGRTAATAASYDTIDINALGDGVKKGGTKISLTNFKAPSFSKLKGHIATLQASDRIDMLEEWIDACEKDPSKEVKAAAKGAIPLLVALQHQFNAAQEAIEGLADKHIPKEIADIFAEAQAAADKIITSYVESAKPIVLPAILQVGAEDDRIDFCYYMEATEFVERKMWIIVTCGLTNMGGEYVMTRHVTVQDRFQAPMNYDFGVATTDIPKSILHALAEEGVLAAMSTVKLKVDQTRITTALRRLTFVKDVEFQGDEIHVHVKNNKQVANQQTEIFAVLTTDTDIRRLLGRTKRLFYVWDENHWVYSVSSRS